MSKMEKKSQPKPMNKMELKQYTTAKKIPAKENKMKSIMNTYRKTGKVGKNTPKNAQHAQRLAAEMAVSELEG